MKTDTLSFSFFIHIQTQTITDSHPAPNNQNCISLCQFPLLANVDGKKIIIITSRVLLLEIKWITNIKALFHECLALFKSLIVILLYYITILPLFIINIVPWSNTYSCPLCFGTCF